MLRFHFSGGCFIYETSEERINNPAQWFWFDVRARKNNALNHDWIVFVDNMMLTLIIIDRAVE